MKLSKRGKRTAKKLFLPLIAVAMMVSAMAMGASPPSASSLRRAPQGAAARFAHDLHQR